jgi:hypothetical protein
MRETFLNFFMFDFLGDFFETRNRLLLKNHFRGSHVLRRGGRGRRGGRDVAQLVRNPVGEVTGLSVDA